MSLSKSMPAVGSSSESSSSESPPSEPSPSKSPSESDSDEKDFFFLTFFYDEKATGVRYELARQQHGIRTFSPSRASSFPPS